MRLADLARVRQAGYRLFSSALLYPDEERFETLGAVAQELEGRSRRLAEFAFFPQWSRFVRALVTWADGGMAGVEQAYVRLFVVSPDGICPPYASHYLAPGAPAQVMAEVEGEYARAGFSVPPSLGEPPDHIAVELEFMGLLCAEEAEAWNRRSPGDAVQRLDREASFLDRHLSRWFAEFFDQVAALDGGGFYTLATDAARAFLAHDLDLTTALLGRYREVATA
jgi:TorA maturation chaperone TorD